LKEKGFSIHHLGRYNRTPLMEACMYGTSGRQEKKKMREIITYLLDNGALTSPIDDFGRNALYYAEQEHYDKELCIALTPPITN
jgi:hypothetical protein